MNTFLKTFFFCLVVVLGFLAYTLFGEGSYDKNLKLSKQSPIFSMDKGQNKVQTQTQEPDEIIPNKQEQKVVEKPKPTKHTHTCFFYTPSGKLIPLERQMPQEATLENTIVLLLKGPLITESKKGIYTEIPPKVDLISLKRENNSIIVNLTSNFGSGGGSQSIENRVQQLSKTVKNLEPDKDIYLYIDNKEVEYLGGDGVYIKQPLD